VYHEKHAKAEDVAAQDMLTRCQYCRQSSVKDRIEQHVN